MSRFQPRSAVDHRIACESNGLVIRPGPVPFWVRIVRFGSAGTILEQAAITSAR